MSFKETSSSGCQGAASARAPSVIDSYPCEGRLRNDAIACSLSFAGAEGHAKRLLAPELPVEHGMEPPHRGR